MVCMQTTSCKADRRSRRSQEALRAALAAEINEGEELSRVTVAALTERAGCARRTFYSHYRDMPDFVAAVEEALLIDIRKLIHTLAATTLPELYQNIAAIEPAPASIELLQYFMDNRALIGALLGSSGDPAFIKKLAAAVQDEVAERMRTGIFPAVLGSFFDYYLSYVVAAELGVVQRWFERGLVEPPETMARIMTVIAFVRPGDLYGLPIDINVPEYGQKLMSLNLSTKES